MNTNQYEPEELLPLVAQLAQKYTGCDSTSLPYEKAQQLMEAVLYCINEISSDSTPAVQGLTAQEAYSQGCHILTQKVHETKNLYHQLFQNFADYENLCLHDTVLNGIPEFFKWYDIKFQPQNTILTLDYPILTDLNSYTGIDAVHLYLKDIWLEQLFLNKLDPTYILAILDAYSGGAKDLIENLCSIILPNILGHLLLNKSFSVRRFSKEDINWLHNCFTSKSPNETELLLSHSMQEFVNHFYDGSIPLSNFLEKSIANLIPRLYNAIDHHHLDMLFML